MAKATTYTSTTTSSLRRVAIDAYARTGSPQAAWEAVRARMPRLRAARWDEQICANSGQRRSYSCPLGTWLAIPGAQHEYGHHCAAYRRTQRSLRAADTVAEIVRDWLEAQACALV